jgi:hypothetical protein
MSSTLEATLWVSVISIILLFASMAIIWLLMSLMSRIPDKKEGEPEAIVDKVVETPIAAVIPTEDKTGKVQAAAVAVAAALALQAKRTRLVPTTASSAQTPWQSAHWANVISRRNQIITRRRG